MRDLALSIVFTDFRSCESTASDSFDPAAKPYPDDLPWSPDLEYFSFEEFLLLAPKLPATTAFELATIALEAITKRHAPYSLVADAVYAIAPYLQTSQLRGIVEMSLQFPLDLRLRVLTAVVPELLRYDYDLDVVASLLQQMIDTLRNRHRDELVLTLSALVPFIAVLGETESIEALWQNVERVYRWWP